MSKDGKCSSYNVKDAKTALEFNHNSSLLLPVMGLVQKDRSLGDTATNQKNREREDYKRHSVGNIVWFQ